MYLKTLQKKVFSSRLSRQVQLSYSHGTSTKPLLSEHVSQRLRTITDQYPTNIALISHHQQIRMTYEQMNDKVDKLAKGLVALGLNKGDRIGIYAQNKAEWTLLQFAASRADLILVNVNPAFQQNELQYALKQVGIKTLVMTDKFKSSNYVQFVRDLIPQLDKATNPLDLGHIPEYPNLKNIVLIADHKEQGMINFEDLYELYDSNDDYQLQLREKEIDFESPTNIQFTSGTTGYPKGATLSHFGILNNAYNIGSFMRLTSKDKIIIPVPLYHCFGMVIGNLCALNYGAAMIYPSESFDAKAALECTTQYKATTLYGVPTMFIAMIEEYIKNKDKYDISHLRTGFISGSGVPEALMDKIRDVFNIQQMTQGYGQTECSPVVTQSEANDKHEKKSKTVGRATPHVEVKIVNPETGKIVPMGDAGEVCARGYLVMNGYWNDEKKTKDTIDERGWIKTGDLGQFDEDGFLKIIGRSKDMIIRGGENIYPKELEEYFMKHPNVYDIQVIGVNDEFMGEEVCAWIKFKQEDKTTVQDLLDYCQGQISHYKIPRYVRFVKEFPLTVTGKVKKNDMRHLTNELLRQPQNDIQEMKAKKKNTQK
ncbi:amp-binding domain protein [Stylonychia lemnae]|uniref:Amp-binding domain protein n=1 Tax=Stylonychia lemnae TaxID=5949 RepID=A0A078AK23_STYLE|nr:amp-binding domain protein [Stylonychia lemnae]|eukprot:CDW82735.1 amp-binding domain protein [Stylonychia lemnae]